MATGSDADCAAVVEALVPALDAVLGAVPLPAALLEQPTRRVLLRLGPEAGILFTLEGGAARVEPWHSSGASPTAPAADTTARLDSVDTLQKLLADPSAAPGLILRRRLRLEGNLSWLQPLMSSLSGNGNAASLMGSLMPSLSSAVSQAIGPARSGSAAAWVPDEASQVCMCCGNTFTVLRRRHHCRACGRLYCGACAPRPAAPRQCALSVGRGGGWRPARRCAECVRGGAPPTFSSTSSALTTVPMSFSAPQASFAATGEIKQEVEELKKQLHEIRREQLEFAARQVHLAVQRVWSWTQLILLALGATFWCWRWSAFFAYLTGSMVLHTFKHSMLRRNIQVFWAALVMFILYKRTKSHIRNGQLDAKEAERAWFYTHCVLARFMHEQMTALGGFWTKLGQHLSVNAALPLPYLLQLRQLQDSLPPSPLEEILTTIREEFGAAVAGRLFVDPKADALGVASVAQVHKAEWLPPGAVTPRQIVVKVQHRGAAERFRQDLRAAAMLARIAWYVDPEGLPDLRPIIRTIREVTISELDFRCEAANQTRAAETVRRVGVDVMVPAVVPELVATRAMAMEFVDGVRLGRLAEELPGADRQRLVAALVDHYGVQFTVDGHFHADPHPGNLLVERSSGQLVVLDWGQCITLPQKKVDAYARLFYACAVSDLWALTQALEDIGITFKDGEVFEPCFFMAALRFALRDSQPMDLAREELEKAMQMGDDLYYKGPKRYQKSPANILTGEFIYFGKALELLYMVSSELGVSHSILQSILWRAYGQLTGRSALGAKIPDSPEQFLPALQVPYPAARNRLEHDLCGLLRELYKQGRLLGAQLCVLGHSATTPGAAPSTLVDAAVGVCGWLDTELVTSKTLFNLLDISKLGVALVVLRLIDTSVLALGDRLADRWPGLHCASGLTAGAGGLTVEEVLGHLAGLWGLLPPSAKEVRDLVDFEAMLAAWEGAPAMEPPGRAQRYHQASFGYLCAGICRHLAGRELPALWEELAAAVAEHGCLDVSPQELSLVLPPGRTSGVALPAKAITSASLAEVSAMLSKLGEFLDDDELSLPAKAARQIFGKEHLVDLSLFSRRGDVAGALLPGLQGFGTARAVASMVSSVQRGDLLSHNLAQQMRRSRRPAGDYGTAARELNEEFGHIAHLEPFQEWGLGVQLLRPEAWGSEIGASSDPAWGHLSQNGSAVLFMGGPRPVTVALLLNMLDAECAQHVTWAVLRLVEQHVMRRACGADA